MAAKRKSKTSKRTNTTVKGGERQASLPAEPRRGSWPSAVQARSAAQSRRYAFRRS